MLEREKLPLFCASVNTSYFRTTRILSITCLRSSHPVTAERLRTACLQINYTCLTRVFKIHILGKVWFKAVVVEI